MQWLAAARRACRHVSGRLHRLALGACLLRFGRRFRGRLWDWLCRFDHWFRALLRAVRQTEARRRIFCASRLTFEIGALLDGKRQVIDVAFDAARRLEKYAFATYGAHHVSTNDHFVGNDASGDHCAFADEYVGAMDVPVDFAFDLHLTARDEVAGDL